MKTRQKLFIDAFIGDPLAFLLNLVVRLVGFILNIDHSLDRPFKTIVVSKYVGMGSIIQTTPLLQTLKAKYPQAQIIFVTNDSNKTLLEHITAVDKVLTINDKSTLSILKSISLLIISLWKKRPDVFIDLEIYSNVSSIITSFSLSTNRFGFFKNDKKYRMGLYTHMMYFNRKAPVSEAYLQFARLLGCKEIVTKLSTFDLSEQEKQNSDSALLNLSLEKGKYVVINPNASDLRIERRWPAENFVRLIKKMADELPGYKMVLIGAKNEADFVKTISSTNEKLIDTSGKLSLVNLIYLISNAALLVTNDTGPMHIGFAQGTKTIALFGPCSPDQYGNTGKAHLIYKNVYCSPCVHEFIIPPCKGDNQCMKLITVEEVWKEVAKSLQGTNLSNSSSEPIIYESDHTLGQVFRK
jgi:ADP-heptose:LPS heptosyltransferase